MSEIAVTYGGEDRLIVAVRGHTLALDQPKDDGGTDVGPTPTELFVASLAACVAFYAQRFLRRNGVSADGLGATTTFDVGERPHRVTDVDIDVLLPPGIPQRIRDALPRVMEHCLVHESIRTSPDIKISLTVAEEAA